MPARKQTLITTPDTKKTVALLVGGWSSEREVSLNKGRVVEQALRDAGYTVNRVEVEKDLGKLVAALTPKPDVVFNNLHGTGGEDGVMQGVLEMLEIPYTHSGVMGSAIGMHKLATKRIAQNLGVNVPNWAVTTIPELAKGNIPLPKPYVVKPEAEGSSVGVFIAQVGENIDAPSPAEWPYAPEVLMEQYIPGKELTVAIVDGIPQAVTEIVSATRFFDYEAKYKDTRTRTVCPAEIPAAVYAQALEWSSAIYGALHCSGIARCDWRYDDTKGDVSGLYFLELNSQPGLTPESIGPSQVVYNGYSFQDLCVHLVETATINK